MRRRHRLRAGEETAWILTWFPSWLEVPPARDPRTELERTCAQWTGWLGQVRVDRSTPGRWSALCWCCGR